MKNITKNIMENIKNIIEKNLCSTKDEQNMLIEFTRHGKVIRVNYRYKQVYSLVQLVFRYIFFKKIKKGRINYRR